MSSQWLDRSVLLDRSALLIGQWFGAGRSKLAPGTVGSVAALPLFFLFRSTPGWAYWSATTIVSLGGIAVSQRCAELLSDDDPQSVVIDEVAGVMIALGVVAAGPLWQLALAWVLFRLLDIFKPGIIERVQFLSPKGLGIMADDLLAGMAAGALAYFLPELVARVSA